MEIIDARTGHVIADSAYDPLSHIKPAKGGLMTALSPYILSASGWRNVYAASKDEEDPTTSITDEDALVTAHIAATLFNEVGKAEPRILLAVDARPTGRVLAHITLRVLTGLGAAVDYLYIASAPEAMAFSHAGYDAFCYISASHNPIGHNGFKFGVDGGVYERSITDRMATALKEALAADDAAAKAMALSAAAGEEAVRAVLEAVPAAKERSLAYYTDFVFKTAGVDPSFRASVGIVADLNGSARSVSIDKTFLKGIGCPARFFNDKAGQVAHAIVPEGENLVPCRDALAQAYKEDSSFALAYCPDNDGDRGNFAYIRRDGSASILQAQEVFALVVAIELADLSRKGEGPLAVAVNCPTSERIEAIASAFGAKVFRAEVGEANVVNLGQELRDRGYVVHVLGEGSNGGNITDPAKVRDPLNSIMTFLKLLADKGLYSYATGKLSGKEATGGPSIDGLLEAMPSYTTTGAFSTLAKLHVKHGDWARIKEAYEGLFLKQWEEKDLSAWGIVAYEVHQTEGTVERIGLGPAFRSPAAKGGEKVVFLDKDGGHVAYMWMRPSGTEPVLRVLVDVRGENEALHDELLAWQRSLITEADRSLD